VDQNQSYQTYCDEKFEELLPGISPIKNLPTIVDAMTEQQHCCIGNFLDIHNNAKAWLLNPNVRHRDHGLGPETNRAELRWALCRANISRISLRCVDARCQYTRAFHYRECLARESKQQR
jgi:hypothetical protein